VIFLPASYIQSTPNNDLQQSIKQILSFSDSSTGSKSLGKNSGNFHFGNPISKRSARPVSRSITALVLMVHSKEDQRASRQISSGSVTYAKQSFHHAWMELLLGASDGHWRRKRQCDLLPSFLRPERRDFM
jgi:hypothetical protein